MRRLLAVAPLVFLGCSGSSSSPATPSQPVTAAQCATLSPTSASILAPGGLAPDGIGSLATFAVVATAGDAVRCPWTVSTTDDWILGVAPTSGTGSATVSYSINENRTTAPRIGSILVAWAGGSTAFTVNQAGASCPPSQTFQEPASGAYLNFALGPNGCFRNATFAIDVSWLRADGTNASGGRFLALIVDPNPGAPRTGHLTMSGINGNGLYAQYTFVQAGP